MKVAILKSGFSHTGGLEKYATYLAEAFAKRGCTVTILTSLRRHQKKPPKKRGKLPYKLVTLGKQTWLGVTNRLDFDRKCTQWLADHPQDIVFGMDRNSSQTHYRVGEGVHMAYLERRCQTESLRKRFSFLLNPLHRVNLQLEKKTFCDPNMRAFFTNSHMVRNEVLSHYPVPETKIHVVHNGVEWHDLEPLFNQWSEAEEGIIEDLGLDQDRFQFLFIGNGWRRKGLSYLLNGLSLLPQDSYQLSIIGREKYPREYYEQIRRLGLEDNVKVFGPRHDVHRFMQMADSVVIPSLYDPFANVTTEALAMGLHVVSSEYNGGKEILNADNGTIIPSLLCPDSMCATLETVLKKPKTPAQAHRIRDSVRHLDFSSQLNKILDVTLCQ